MEDSGSHDEDICKICNRIGSTTMAEQIEHYYETTIAGLTQDLERFKQAMSEEDDGENLGDCLPLLVYNLHTVGLASTANAHVLIDWMNDCARQDRAEKARLN